MSEALLIARPGLIPGLFVLAMYFLPTIIAAVRGHPQTAPILVLNFFLGWTVIGWIATLAWSVSNFRGRTA